MSYTNVVFNQKIARNVDRDEIEHQRINDRSNHHLIQLDSNPDFRPQALSSSRHPNSPLSASQVTPPTPRTGTL